MGHWVVQDKNCDGTRCLSWLANIIKRTLILPHLSLLPTLVSQKLVPIPEKDNHVSLCT